MRIYSTKDGGDGRPSSLAELVGSRFRERPCFRIEDRDKLRKKIRRLHRTHTHVHAHMCTLTHTHTTHILKACIYYCEGVSESLGLQMPLPPER